MRYSTAVWAASTAALLSTTAPADSSHIIFNDLPPAGLDILNSSPQDLARYNLPPRPVDSEDLKAWQGDMSLLQNALAADKLKATTFTKMPNLHSKFKPAPGAQKNTRFIGSTNWSGFAEYANTGLGPTVTTLFQQPAIDFSTGGASFWSGIGGLFDNFVMQSGSVCLPNRPPCLAFVEFFPDNAFVGFPINQGDLVYASQFHSVTSPHGNLLVVDFTTGDYGNASLDCGSCGSDPYRSPTSEEFGIVEAFDLNGSQVPLANYSPVSFNSNGGRFQAGDPNAYNITMINGGKPVSICTLTGNQSFVCRHN